MLKLDKKVMNLGNLSKQKIVKVRNIYEVGKSIKDKEE